MLNQSKNHSNKAPGLRRSTLMIALALIVVFLGVCAFVLVKHYTDKPKITKTQNGAAISNPNVPGGDISKDSAPGASTPPSNGISNSKDGTANEPGSAPSPDTQPAKPIGDFVSSHQAALGTPENSTCTTTAGTNCQIKFTSGSVVKSLPVQDTNRDGSTSWDWTPQEIGLTAGQWEITAIATNKTLSAATTDSMPLTVQ